MNQHSMAPRVLILVIALSTATWIVLSDPLSVGRLLPGASGAFSMLVLAIGALGVIWAFRSLASARREEWRTGWYAGVISVLHLTSAGFLALSVPAGELWLWLGVGGFVMATLLMGRDRFHPNGVGESVSQSHSSR